MEKAPKNITPAPRTRLEKRQSIVLRNKRLVAGIVSVFALLLVLSSAYLILKDLNKHEPKTNVASTKTTDQSKSTIKATTGKISSEKNNVKPSKLSSTEYILPESNKKVLGEEDIANLSKEQLRLARNEIYARHGYVFKSEDLQKYFSSKSWYHENTSYDGSLSEVEKDNVTLLKAREDQM